MIKIPKNGGKKFGFHFKTNWWTNYSESDDCSFFFFFFFFFFSLTSSSSADSSSCFTSDSVLILVPLGEESTSAAVCGSVDPEAE